MSDILYVNEDHSIFSEMLKHRIVRLDGDVDTVSAAIIISSIRFLEKQNPRKPIQLLINSMGGSVVDGFAIIDTMRNCLCRIDTYVYGEASSIASAILAAGDRRYAAPNAEIMFHQPSGERAGTHTSLDTHGQCIGQERERMVILYAQQTGLRPEDIDSLLNNDQNLPLRTAKDLGFIDDILTQELYFQMMHGKQVPAWKKPRFPENIRTAPPKNILEHLQEELEGAAKRRLPAANASSTPVKGKLRKP
jgi:ATP-dependent Clp protease protease subunit